MSTATTAGIIEACGSTCLKCCDGRQGLRVDISGCLPVVGSYTTSEATDNDFEILSVDWAIDTSKPIYFGQEVNGAGHINVECCEQWVGSMVATWTTPTDGVPLTAFHYIYVGINANEVYMRFFHFIGAGTGADFPYFFRFFKASTGMPSGSESPLCSIKRSGWTTLGNTQAADYDATKIYITESDGYEIDVIPTYGNQDGGHLHPGTGTTAMNPDDIADPSNCQACSLVEDWKITISGMSSICLSSLIKPGDNTAELEFTITGGVFAWTPITVVSVSDQNGAGANCSGDPGFTCFDPTNISTYTVSASVDFIGSSWNPPDTQMIRVTIAILCECDDISPLSTSGEAFFNLTCSGGIESDSQSVTLSGGAGTITVNCVPA